MLACILDEVIIVWVNNDDLLEMFGADTGGE